MTLNDFLAKFEGILLSSPMTRAAIIDLVQDERADERRQCELLGDTYSFELAKYVNDGKSWFIEGYTKAISDYQEAIHNRNMKEVE